jgi:hypothetical protein
MSKWANDLVMDAALDYIAGATVMHACTTLDATPTLAEVAAASLADVAMAGGDFSKANGDVSGRKVTVAAKSAVPVDASGDAVDIALVDGSVVRYVTTCTQQTLTSGNTVNFPSWDAEIGDPT